MANSTTHGRYRTKDCIGWQCDWYTFLDKHSKSGSGMRPSEDQKAALTKTVVADSARTQRELGNLSLAVIMDVTGSMKDALDEVKEKIDKQLLEEIGYRCGVMLTRLPVHQRCTHGIITFLHRVALQHPK